MIRCLCLEPSTWIVVKCKLHKKSVHHQKEKLEGALHPECMYIIKTVYSRYPTKFFSAIPYGILNLADRSFQLYSVGSRSETEEKGAHGKDHLS